MAILIVVTALICAAGGYGTYLALRPNPIAVMSMCHRDFELQGSATTKEVIVANGDHLIPFGSPQRTFRGDAVWTFDTVNGQRTQALTGGCHVLMYTQQETDSFRTYALEGGP